MTISSLALASESHRRCALALINCEFVTSLLSKVYYLKSLPLHSRRIRNLKEESKANQNRSVQTQLYIPHQRKFQAFRLYIFSSLLKRCRNLPSYCFRPWIHDIFGLFYGMNYLSFILCSKASVLLSFQLSKTEFKNELFRTIWNRIWFYVGKSLSFCLVELKVSWFKNQNALWVCLKFGFWLYWYIFDKVSWNNEKFTSRTMRVLQFALLHVATCWFLTLMAFSDFISWEVEKLRGRDRYGECLPEHDSQCIEDLWKRPYWASREVWPRHWPRPGDKAGDSEPLKEN